MTEARTGGRDQLIIWAAGEARRLRRQPAPDEQESGPFRDAATFVAGAAVLDGEVVVHMAGELDGDTAPRLREVLDGVRDRAVSTLVFEMAELSFIDSSGLNELIVALKRQREAGGEVVLRDPSPQTRRVLEIVGFSEIFTIA